MEDNDRPDSTSSPLREHLAGQGDLPYYRAGVNILFVRKTYQLYLSAPATPFTHGLWSPSLFPPHRAPACCARHSNPWPPRQPSPGSGKSVVLGNGGSRDSEIVCARFPFLPVTYQYREPTTPPLEHMQILMRECLHGELTAFLHDDDWWTPTHLASALAGLDASSRCGRLRLRSLRRLRRIVDAQLQWQLISVVRRQLSHLTSCVGALETQRPDGGTPGNGRALFDHGGADGCVKKVLLRLRTEKPFRQRPDAPLRPLDVQFRPF